MTVIPLYPRGTPGAQSDGECPPIKRKKRRLVLVPDPAGIIARSLDAGRPMKTMVPTGAIDPAAIIARALDRPDWRRPPTLVPRQPVPAPVKVAAQSSSRNEGSDGRFWAVWLEHSDYLRRQSLRMTGNRFDAEDALSTAMLRAARVFSRIEIRNHRAWLFRVLHNVCMDQHRHHQRQPLYAEPIGDELQQPAALDGREAERSPEDRLADTQLVQALERALAGLPMSLVEPLLLYLDDKSDAEIADSLEVTREVVRKRRQIARDRLRQQILS